jgi:hypothetical protein
MASPSRKRRPTQARKTNAATGESRLPSPGKANALKSRGGDGKQKARTRAKQPPKAPRPQTNAARGGARPSRETKRRGKSRTANLPDRISSLGRFPTNDYFADAFGEIRDEIKGLRSGLQELREECRDANREAAAATHNLIEHVAQLARVLVPRVQSRSPHGQQRNGEDAEDAKRSHSDVSSPKQARGQQTVVGEVKKGGVPSDGPPREKEVLADYALLRQQTRLAEPGSTKTRRPTAASLEILLVRMFLSNAYQAAEHPTSFTAAQMNKVLVDRTYRDARAWLRHNEFVSATISPIPKKMNPMHGGKESVQEYWTDIWLTERGVALARHIDGLGLPHLKHVDANGNKAEALNAATGSSDRPAEET